MSKRESLEQNLHDSIVSQVAKVLIKKGLMVRTNPGESKLYSVRTGDDTYYPDVYSYKNGKVIEIYEVETENTVNEESISQWKQYSSGNAKFYLVVPKIKLESAKELVKKHNISVDSYWTF